MQEKAQHSRQWEKEDGIQEDYRRASTVSVMFYILNESCTVGTLGFFILCLKYSFFNI